MQNYDPKRATPKQRENEVERRSSLGYSFTIDGQSYTLTPVDDLNGVTLRDIMRLPMGDMQMTMLEKLADADTLDAVLAQRGAELREWFRTWEKWQAAESVTLPESVASST